ncbi:hypothetical protein Ddc_24736 [Ditylenchus destructor]|nr:hypothetical protein Ddc_24736 [Ditylenchus destructor]
MLRHHHTSCAEKGIPVPEGIPVPTVDELIRQFYFPTERDCDFEEGVSQLPPDDFHILTSPQKNIILQLEKSLAADPLDISVPRLFTLQGSDLHFESGDENGENTEQTFAEKDLGMNIEEDVFRLNEDADDLEAAPGEKIVFEDLLDEEMGIPDYDDQNPLDHDPHNIESEMTL